MNMYNFNFTKSICKNLSMINSGTYLHCNFFYTNLVFPTVGSISVGMTPLKLPRMSELQNLLFYCTKMIKHFIFNNILIDNVT